MAADPNSSSSSIWGDRAAEIWETRFEPQRGPLFAAVIEETKIGSGSRVLDAGCGGGGVSAAASAAGANVNGCDISEGVLAIARRKVPAGTFKVADIAALPYADDQFDTVIACDSLLSPKHARSAISELSRVCSRTGQICIVTWGPPSQSDYSRILDAMQSRLREKPTVTPLALSEPGVLDLHVAQAGLHIRRERIVGFDYRFSSFDDYWACGRELAGLKLIFAVAGEDSVRQAAYLAAKPSIQTSGELVMRNSFRLVIMNPKPQSAKT
jgi:SAM-dependent methyltransferase